MATPGLSAALPEGLPLFEALFAPEPLLKLAETNETAGRVLKDLGIDKIGPGRTTCLARSRGDAMGIVPLGPGTARGLAGIARSTCVRGRSPPLGSRRTCSATVRSASIWGKAYKLLRDVMGKGSR